MPADIAFVGSLIFVSFGNAAKHLLFKRYDKCVKFEMCSSNVLIQKGALMCGAGEFTLTMEEEVECGAYLKTVIKIRKGAETDPDSENFLSRDIIHFWYHDWPDHGTCVCVHVCECICLIVCSILCVCVCICVRVFGVCACICLILNSALCTCVCACVRACEWVWVCVCACVWVYMCVHVCISCAVCKAYRHTFGM